MKPPLPPDVVVDFGLAGPNTENAGGGAGIAVGLERTVGGAGAETFGRWSNSF